MNAPAARGEFARLLEAERREARRRQGELLQRCLAREAQLARLARRIAELEAQASPPPASAAAMAGAPGLLSRLAHVIAPRMSMDGGAG